MSKQATTPSEATELMALTKALDKAQPDPGTLRQLRAYLDANPQVADVLGNLCTMTSDQLLERGFPTVSKREMILARLRHMRDELGYADAGELERSLIEHTIMCWVRLHDCELRYSAAIAESMTLTKAEWWERKLAHNQRRYLKACETLARVRRLLQPKKVESNPAFTLLMKQQLGIR